MNLSLQLENRRRHSTKRFSRPGTTPWPPRTNILEPVAPSTPQASFTSMRPNIENGRATAVEYNEAQVEAPNAESDLIQAKYDYLFRIKILSFYKGEPIE
jgi:outer membrane protein